jgi:DNA polymerase I
MIEGPVDSIEEIVARTQEAMVEASALVLDGFRLRSDAKIVRWLDRYMDQRGEEFWGRVAKLFQREYAASAWIGRKR